MSNSLLVENRQNAVIVTFNRPQIRSPLSVAVLVEIDRILDRARADNAEKIIFTGRENVFASGADLREIAALTAAQARTFAERGQNLMSKIASLPTVAAINGYCFGGALDLAISCRRRIAAANAQFCHPGVKLGIVTGWSGTQRLPRLIGAGRAMEMFLTAKIVDADEALRIGLIDRISRDPLADSFANF